MTTLYPIPWNPDLYLTRDTLDLLGRASELAGHNIECSEAWRTYSQQKGYWDARVAFLNGTGPYAPPASNPDDPNGQNNHRRAAAVDIVRRADRGFMLAAGFTPDADEWWHFNNPNWRRMPIVNDAALAALSATPIPTGDEVDMASREDIRADVQAVITAAIAPLTDDEEREKDATRRESRPWRLFRNTDRTGQPDEFVAIAYALPPTDPRQEIRLNARDAKALNESYQMTADTPTNARPLNSTDIETLIRLANGTDRIYSS
jgi:hypothetical protein